MASGWLTKRPKMSPCRSVFHSQSVHLQDPLRQKELQDPKTPLLSSTLWWESNNLQQPILQASAEPILQVRPPEWRPEWPEVFNVQRVDRFGGSMYLDLESKPRLGTSDQ